MMEFTGAAPEEAVRMSSVNQAREFGLKKKGGLEEGMDADILVMDAEFGLMQTISLGSLA